MTKKKRILSVIMAVALVASMMFADEHCGVCQHY